MKGFVALIDEELGGDLISPLRALFRGEPRIRAIDWNDFFGGVICLHLLALGESRPLLPVKKSYKKRRKNGEDEERKPYKWRVLGG